jgi:hypothetical protein
MNTSQAIKAIDAEIKIQEAELQRLREEKAAIVQEENHVDKLFDAVLNCPHSITHESVTLHFYPRQKEGHNALAQLHHRIADYELAARQREMQLLGEIEALERLALNALKQLGVETTPIAWYVTGCSTMLDEHDAKSEAKRCGGSAKAVPLYTEPPPPAIKLDAARLLYVTKDIDGYVHVKRNKYDFALECMEEAGRSEPTIEDALNGVRRLIDAAIEAQAKQGDALE